MTDADHVIVALGLEPHPEGGWFRETWREPAVTAIHYLLRAGERSHWHRVDRTEIWHFYAGDPLELVVSPDGRDVVRHVLGTDLGGGQIPQAVVPAGAWQSAVRWAGGPLPGARSRRRSSSPASTWPRRTGTLAGRTAFLPVSVP